MWAGKASAEPPSMSHLYFKGLGNHRLSCSLPWPRPQAPAPGPSTLPALTGSILGCSLQGQGTSNPQALAQLLAPSVLRTGAGGSPSWLPGTVLPQLAPWASVSTSTSLVSSSLSLAVPSCSSSDFPATQAGLPSPSSQGWCGFHPWKSWLPHCSARQLFIL